MELPGPPKCPKIMEPILPVLSILGYGAIAFGASGVLSGTEDPLRPAPAYFGKACGVMLANVPSSARAVQRSCLRTLDQENARFLRRIT